MKKVAFVLVVVAFAFGCTFPEQYKETRDLKVDEMQNKVLNMSDDEFLQHAKKEDPNFRENVNVLDESASKMDEILHKQETQDEELRILVESETSKKAILINSMADLEDTEELKAEELSTETTSLED
ncbi:hypothetical protein JXQ70_11395 [bacterium]|nr:hypothetical protein [bacterium]